MKFACEQCGKRYATAEEPLPGRVYRIRCRACGHVIVLRGPAAAAVDEPRVAASPPPTPPPPVEAPSPAPAAEGPLAAGDGEGAGDGAWREEGAAASPVGDGGAAAAAHPPPATPAPEVATPERAPAEPPIAPEQGLEAGAELGSASGLAPAPASEDDLAPAPQRPALELGRIPRERPRSRILLVALGVVVLLALAAVALLRGR